MPGHPTRTRTGAARFWARRELARRWRATVLLGLLAGAAGGVSIAAVAGARRTHAAFPRYKAATAAPDAIVFGTQAGSHTADYGPVRRLPEVAASGEFALAAITISSHHQQIGGLPPADSQLYRTVARPLLVAGRLPDPHRLDEVVVNRTAAAKFGLAVGDRVTMRSANDLNAFYGQAPMRGGPTIPARVVGIGDSTMDQIFQPDEPGFFPSGAVLERYGVRHGDVPAGHIEEATNLVVRLRPGTDLATFHADVARVLHLRADEIDGAPVPGSQVPIRDLAEDDKRVVHATDLERVGLLLFAAAAALASLVLVGQAIARSVDAMAVDAPTLRSIGLVRTELIRGLVLPQVAVAGLGGAVAVAVSVALSPLFPVGLAGRLDPDQSVHLDAVVVLPGAAIVILAVLTAAALAAWRAAGTGRLRAPGRTSTLGRWARATLPLPVGLGVGLAVDRGHGSRSLPTRPAIVGAVAAVTGVVGCFGLIHGIDDALTTPTRSGQIWQATAYPESEQDFSAVTEDLGRDRNVVASGVMERVAATVQGTEVPTYAVTPLHGRNPFVVVSGRVPRRADEIALGPASAAALHRHVGDHLRLRIDQHRPVTLTVTGIALLPQTPHSSFDQGAAITPGGLTRATGLRARARYDTAERTAVVAAFHSHPAQSIEALHGRTGVEVDPIATPQDVLNLRNVRPLPRAVRLPGAARHRGTRARARHRGPAPTARARDPAGDRLHSPPDGDQRRVHGGDRRARRARRRHPPRDRARSPRLALGRRLHATRVRRARRDHRRRPRNPGHARGRQPARGRPRAPCVAPPTGEGPPDRVIASVTGVSLCDNCARDEPELLAVRRVYVVPEQWDTPASETVVDEVEHWCVSCCTQYPHEPSH